MSRAPQSEDQTRDRGARTHRALIRLALFCFVFAALGLTARANPYAGDAAQMCNAAESILARGELDIPPARDDVPLGRGGKYYSKYPLLAVLQCVPAVLLRNAAQIWKPGDLGLEGFALGIPPHTVTGVLAVGLFELALAFDASVVTALVFALLVVFTTPIWPAGRSLYSEALQATLAVFFVLAALRARDAGARGAFLAAGLLAGLAINAKVLLGLLPLAMLVDQAHERWDSRRIKGLGLACLGALPGVIAWLVYNHVRYGNVLAQGYSTGRDGSLGFGAPLLAGLYALLLSSGKSVFLYSPLLVGALCGVGSFWRERRRDLYLVAIPTVGTLLVVSKWWAWSGDWAWGPRLLLPVVPLACLPALRLLERRGAGRAVVLALCALGLYVQVLAVAIAPSHFILVTDPAAVTAIGNPAHRKSVRDDLLALHFVPELNPIVGQHWLLMRYLHKPPWTESSDYPWKSLGIPAYRPSQDPTPAHLDLWTTNASSLVIGLAAVFAALTLAFGTWLVMLARKAN